MKTITSIAVTLAFLTAGAAHAATLDITLGSTITYNYNAGQTPAASNITLSNGTSGLDRLNNSILRPSGSNLTNYWTSPTGLTGPRYLAVLGLTPNRRFEDEGETIFTLAPGYNEFGFSWGTIDTYNLLTLNGTGGPYTITGADILSHLTSPTTGVTQVSVEIYDPLGNLLSAEFQSTGNSFEVGNFSETRDATPLPPAVILFGSGLAALVLFGRHRWMKA